MHADTNPGLPGTYIFLKMLVWGEIHHWAWLAKIGAVIRPSSAPDTYSYKTSGPYEQTCDVQLPPPLHPNPLDQIIDLQLCDDREVTTT